jgi:HPt (histidine-containing phosphotransfer) domain-containing protein
MHDNDKALIGEAGAAPVAAPGDAVNPAVIDRRALDRLGELDPDGRQGLVRRVLQTYETSLARQLQDFVQARAGGDVQQLGRIAHTLKSSSAAIGAQTLAQDCAAIEHGIRVEHGMPQDAALDALVAQAHAVRRAVAAMLGA